MAENLEDRPGLALNDALLLALLEPSFESSFEPLLESSLEPSFESFLMSRSLAADVQVALELSLRRLVGHVDVHLRSDCCLRCHDQLLTEVTI